VEVAVEATIVKPGTTAGTGLGTVAAVLTKVEVEVEVEFEAFAAAALTRAFTEVSFPVDPGSFFSFIFIEVEVGRLLPGGNTSSTISFTSSRMVSARR
jgi:hypothetical protein